MNVIFHLRAAHTSEMPTLALVMQGQPTNSETIAREVSSKDYQKQ